MTDKYGLRNMQMGEEKKFLFSEYNKIKTAACNKGKYWGTKYSTEIRKYKNGKKYFVVIRRR